MSENITKEGITYITMLSAMQVVLNCQLELKGTRVYQGKVKDSIFKAVDQMKHYYSFDRDKIWKIDDVTAANIMYAIDKLSEAIAKSNGTNLAVITHLLRADIDLSKCVITELDDEEIEKLGDGK